MRIGNTCFFGELVAVDGVTHDVPQPFIVIATQNPIGAAGTQIALSVQMPALIAVLMGGLSIIAPSRRKDVAQLGFKAVVAGSLSNLMSAVIAGLFIGLSGAAIVG